MVPMVEAGVPGTIFVAAWLWPGRIGILRQAVTIALEVWRTDLK